MKNKERKIICKHVKTAWLRLRQYEKEHENAFTEDEERNKLLWAWVALYYLANELGITEETWL